MAALDRTLLLMRDHLMPIATDAALIDALSNTRILIAADWYNVCTQEGQDCLVATISLVARSGATIYLDIPNVDLIGLQPPLRLPLLLDALLDLGRDIIPGCEFIVGHPPVPPDLTLLLGDTTIVGSMGPALNLSGDAWFGRIGSEGNRWKRVDSPFGALAASGLAAGEAFKVSMRKLGHLAASARTFDEVFSPTTEALVRIAPTGTPLPSNRLGNVDFVSGGAITQNALFALARIPHVKGRARIIEPQDLELSNLNRYPLLRRSGVGRSKISDLTDLDLDSLVLEGEKAYYQEMEHHANSDSHGTVLVGVDDISVRWAVQRSRPRWLGVGATSHYSAMASFHHYGLPCAGCVHPRDTEPDGHIPTVAFVSHWAGLWLASLFVRQLSGEKLSSRAQVLYSSLLQPANAGAVWISAAAPREDCPLACTQWNGVALI